MIRALLSILLAFVVLTPSAHCHCEVPCGIYDDEARLKSIEEDIDTIDKAVKNIAELSSAPEKDYNQLVRWINAKDDHADKIQYSVSQYFLTQRVKPADPGDAVKYREYTRQLAVLHEMLVLAMKAKQTVDPAVAASLRKSLAEFAALYRGK